MTSITTPLSRLRETQRQLLSAEVQRRLRRFALPAALVALVAGLVIVAVRGESNATLPVDVRVVSTSDPMHLGATTRATVQLTNNGDHAVRPRFSLTWLPYPYYWRIDSGPPLLKPGETATYRIAAPEALAAPHDGERFEIRVNDATSITYAMSRPITHGRSVLPIVNPNLVDWTQQDPSSGLYSPAGWDIYSHKDDDDLTAIKPSSAAGIPAAYFHVVQSGKPDPGQWAHTGLTQDIPFPTAPLDVRVLSNVRYQAIDHGWLVTAFGIDIGVGTRESMWLLFEHTGTGDKSYDLPNGQHIEVYDVPLGEWTTRTIDIAALYHRLNWAPPRLVTLKLFMGVSNFTKADIDGYIAGIGPHEAGTAATGG